MSEIPCPGEAQLQQWLDGDADLPVSEAIAAHINDCAICQARLDRFIDHEQLGELPVPAAIGVSAEPNGLTGVDSTPRTAFWSGHGSGAQSSNDEPPPLLARYTGMELLDGGGMGIVYKAHDTKLNRVVAVKVMRRKMAADPENRNRFRREAEAMAQLNHERIVRVYDIGDYDSGDRDRVPYFAMEYVGGGTLAQRIGRRPLPPREAASLAAQLAYGLDHAHIGGVIHRDLKPANILLAGVARPGPGGSTREGLRGSTDVSAQSTRTVQPVETKLPDAKISDFGLARQLDAAAGQTLPGVILGTPSYMAPEQARGDNDEVTARSDVYSLGAVLYEMLTGRPPFEASTGEQTRRLVASDQDPPSVRTLQPGVARDLETICMKCLQKEAGRRYHTAEAVGRDLDNWLGGRPIVARPAGVIERITKVVRRNPLESALVGLLVLTVIGGFAAVLWQLGRVKDRESQVRKFAGQVEEEKEEALRQKRDAIAHRDKSNAYFRMASDAVHQLLITELGEDQLETGLVEGRVKTRPGTDPTRRALLQKAETIYERLLALESDPATGSGVDSAAWYQAQRTLATVLDNLAIYLETAGDTPGAIARRDRSLKLREQLVAASPKVPEFRHGLALSHLNSGIWYRKQGAAGAVQAGELLKSSIAAADALRAENPFAVDYLHLKTRGHANLAALYKANKLRAEATREYETAAAGLKELIRMAPSVFRYQHDHAAVLGELVSIPYETLIDRAATNGSRSPAPLRQFTGQQSFEDTERALWRALTAWEELACDHPDEHDALDGLTTLYYIVGAWYRDNGRRNEQREAWRMSLALSESLVHTHPGVFEYGANLAMVSYNLSMMHLEKQEYQDAVPLLTRTIDLLDGRSIPGHTDPTWFFRMSLLYRAFAQSELGQLDASIADWDRLARIAPADEMPDIRTGRGETLARKGDHIQAITDAELAILTGASAERLIDAARVFALASVAAGRDAARSITVRAALTEMYAARAVALMHQSADAGRFKSKAAVEMFRADPAFEALKDRPDFQAFLPRLSR